MNDSLDRGPTNEDLIALAEAVREAARPEPPRSANIQLSWICFGLTPELFDKLTGWLAEAARQLDREVVTDVEVLLVFVQMLMSDEELSARVITALRREGDL
jgi:hypothetical protein